MNSLRRVLVKFDSEDTAETAVPQQTLPVPSAGQRLLHSGVLRMMR